MIRAFWSSSRTRSFSVENVPTASASLLACYFAHRHNIEPLFFELCDGAPPGLVLLSLRLMVPVSILRLSHRTHSSRKGSTTVPTRYTNKIVRPAGLVFTFDFSPKIDFSPKLDCQIAEHSYLPVLWIRDHHHHVVIISSFAY